MKRFLLNLAMLLGITNTLAACGGMRQDIADAIRPAQPAPVMVMAPAPQVATPAPVPAQQQAATPAPRKTVAPPPAKPAASPAKQNFCKAGENCWRHVGRSPFTPKGSSVKGIDEYLALSSADPDIKAQWRDQVVGNRGVSATMPDGTLYEEQVYTSGGKHVLWRNVRQSIGRDLPGYIYTARKGGYKHVLFLPPKDLEGCDNFSKRPAEKE